MNIIYQKPTSLAFDEAIEQVKQELKQRSFGVLWEFDMAKKLAEHELDLGAKFVVLEVCNPQQAHTVLSQELTVGYFLPCKMVVFEKDGQVQVGTLKPSHLMNQMEGLDLAGVAEEVEQVLQETVDAVAAQ